MFKNILNWTISEEERNDILEKFFVNKLKETFLLFETSLSQIAGL